VLNALAPFLFMAFGFCLGWFLCALWYDSRPTAPRFKRVRTVKERIRRIEITLPDEGEALVVRYPEGEIWRWVGTVDADRDTAEQMPRYGEIDVV
jgi:hypothetical protein